MYIGLGSLIGQEYQTRNLKIPVRIRAKTFCAFSVGVNIKKDCIAPTDRGAPWLSRSITCLSHFARINLVRTVHWRIHFQIWAQRCIGVAPLIVVPTPPVLRNLSRVRIPSPLWRGVYLSVRVVTRSTKHIKNIRRTTHLHILPVSNTGKFESVLTFYVILTHQR